MSALHPEMNVGREDKRLRSTELLGPSRLERAMFRLHSHFYFVKLVSRHKLNVDGHQNLPLDFRQILIVWSYAGPQFV